MNPQNIESVIDAYFPFIGQTRLTIIKLKKQVTPVITSFIL